MFLTQEARKATNRCDRRMQRAELRCAGEKVFVRLPGKAQMKRHVIETQMADADEGSQPRSQDLFPSLRAGREKALASAGHVSILHPEILGVIN